MSGINQRIADYVAGTDTPHKVYAARFGVSPGVFSNILRGKRRIMSDEVVKLAEALGVSVGYLLGEDDQTA